MENKSNSPRWKEVEYSRTKIINAGKTIRSSTEGDEYEQAKRIIDNFRAAHAYPLHVFYIHLRRLASNNDHILVVERVKRLNSIVDKLKREPTMNLWTMQDLGGCRFIVQDLEELNYYQNKFCSSRMRHKLKKIDNYIEKPKTTGYRSVHVVYEFRSDKKETYNRNMLIEIQFRTYLQHIWATAIETMGVSERQKLKAGQGNKRIKRFFALMSSLFAIEEGTAVVPGTPNDKNALITEIRTIDSKEHILDKLTGIGKAFEHEANEIKGKNGYYILILNYDKRIVRFKYFRPSEIDEAEETYEAIESQKSDNLDAVLVRAESIKDLKKAYPNYFLDIAEFVTVSKRLIQ